MKLKYTYDKPSPKHTDRDKVFPAWCVCGAYATTEHMKTHVNSYSVDSDKLHDALNTR